MATGSWNYSRKIKMCVHLSLAHPDLKIFKLRFSNSTGSYVFNYKHFQDEVEKYTATFKLINSNVRSYDAATKCWIFVNSMSDAVNNLIKTLGNPSMLHDWDEFDKFFKLVPESLDVEDAPDPEEFFKKHQPASTTKAPLTKVEIRERFKQIAGFDLNSKSDYRKAALMFHPDRSTESDKMYIINELWREYQNA